MRLSVCAALFLGLSVSAAAADALKLDTGISIEQIVAFGFDSGDLDQARLSLLPEVNLRWGRQWSAELDLRMEAAWSDTGLGTLANYDEFSRPQKFGSDARLEIDKAVVTWRKRSDRLTLGKQTLAWGVLDGLQVTDRFDAVRRREGVFTRQRPERISRWGMRLEKRWLNVQWDTAVLFDGTADQFAQPGDTFEVRAPRLRAGIPAAASLPPIQTVISDSATAGLRAKKTLGSGDLSLLLIHGPDTEPVILTANGVPTITYADRSLFGLTWQYGAGARVWRVESAYIPNQTLNLESPVPRTERRERLLAGAGLDWDLPDNLFMNLQLGVDHVDGEGLVRPNTDVISTLRLQKSYANDTVRVSAEVLSNLADGDGTFRPGVAWQWSDQLRIEAGLDIIWGDARGLIGQFDGADRLWLRATWAI